LQAELDAAFPEADDIWQAELHDLEQLPFLNATAKEALRWSQAVPGILPRTVPAAGYKRGKVYLPPGTSVGMSTLYVHFNPTIFSSPDTFDPSRWFLPGTKDLNHHLEHYLVAFSKGSRRCLGL
ncbi:cytochrome P450, partial [Ceraceosorus guamensis]